MRSINLARIPLSPVRVLVLTAQAWGQAPARQTASRPAGTQRVSLSDFKQNSPRSNESPVAKKKVLRWENVMLQRAEKIDDYSCTLIKRERVNGNSANVNISFSVNLHFCVRHSIRTVH